MLRYFMKFKIGWWILHAVAIILTAWLGYVTEFHP